LQLLPQPAQSLDHVVSAMLLVLSAQLALLDTRPLLVILQLVLKLPLFVKLAPLEALLLLVPLLSPLALNVLLVLTLLPQEALVLLAPLPLPLVPLLASVLRSSSEPSSLSSLSLSDEFKLNYWNFVRSYLFV
jgi:hypothetical protein